MTDSDGTLSPERAAAVWRRAAQLQAEAAQRLEERSRALAVRGEAADAGPHDFTLEEVRAAAVEAGIAPEFVALAVTEVRADPGGALSPSADRAATRYLGVAHRTLEVSRTIDRPAARVYEAMQRVLPAHPWHLALRDITGDALAGGILVFDVPPLSSSNTTPFAYNAASVDVNQLQVMLRPVPGREGEACELVVTAGLVRSVRRNLTASGLLSGVVGTVGGFAGVGVAALAGLAGAAVALPAAAGVAVLGGGTALVYRVAYRHALRKLTGLVEQMVQSVNAHLRTGGAFVPAAWPAQPAGDDDATMAMITSAIT